MLRFYGFLLVLLLWANTILAQKDTAALQYQLKVVDISACRMLYVPQANIQEFDAEALKNRSSQDLGNLLSDYANVNIRSYGYSGLSNVSMRGANANHTAVLWNGFNLQDPMNGGTNMLLFPLFFVDKVQVQKGGSSALFGSGAMGGVISLGNSMKFGQGLQLGVYASAGSFENYQEGVSLGLSGKKAVFLIKVFNKSGKNDFPFTNTEQFGKPEVKQANAELKQWGLLQENAFQISKKQIVKTHFWYQKTDHQLPPNMAQVSSSKSQLDESIRGSIDWNLYQKTWRMTIRNGSFYNKLNYSDPETKIYSEHQSLSNITEAEANIATRKNSDMLNVGLNYTFEKAISEQYGSASQRNRFAIYSSYSWHFLPKFTLVASGREEYIDNRFTPFTYSLKLNTKYIKGFRFFIQYAKNYRIPTFNDLYWFDGMARGNPNLKDESSWDMELGSDYTKNFKTSKLSLRATAFNSRYTNLIKWTPVQGIWMPLNQEEVWSRGVESRINYAWHSKKWAANLGLSYSWIRATLEKKADNEPESILHKQLILTPENQASLNIKLVYGSWSAEFIQDLVGKQYITSDHTDWMQAYTLGNLVFGWNNQLFKMPVSISFRWNNIWNTVYQTMPSYAMPLANFELNFQIHFNHKKSKL